MNKREANLSETERLLRPAWVAVLSVLILHMMSMCGRCVESAAQIDMSTVSAAFSVGAGIMLIVVAGMCIWLLRLTCVSTARSRDAGAGTRYDRRDAQLAISAAIVCLLAAGAIFASVPYWSLGPSGDGTIIATQFGLVWISLFLAIKSLQVAAASITTAAALNILSSRTF